MRKDSVRKLRLEINGMERELPEVLVELITQNHSRISNVYEPTTSLDQTKRHASPVVEALGALYGSMSDFSIKNDYSLIKTVCEHPLADLTYKMVVPSLKKWSSLGLPYISIKFAYIVNIISMIALSEEYKKKDVIVITRTHADAVILGEALTELKMGIRVSTENQGSVLDTSLLPKEYKLVNSIDIFYQDQPGLENKSKSLSIDEVYIDCRDTKELLLYTPGHLFYKEAQNVGYASISIDGASYDDHPIVRAIDTLSNMEGMKGGRKTLVTHFVNMSHLDYQDLKSEMGEKYNIDIFSQHMKDLGAQYGNLTQIEKYKKITTEMAYELVYPILFIDGNKGLTYAAPKAYPDQYIFEEVKSIDDCFKKRLEEYYEELKTQELNPETIDLLYKVNSLLKEV